MDNVWEKIKKGLRDGASLSMEKIEEYTKIGKLKIEEMAARRKIERNFIDIGERFFDLSEEGKASSAESDLIIKKAIESVRTLRSEMEEIDRKIRETSESYKKSKECEPESEEMSGI